MASNSQPIPSSPGPPEKQAEVPQTEPTAQKDTQPAEDEEHETARPESSDAAIQEADDNELDSSIQPFDWDALLEDYDKQTQALNEQEAAIYADFDSLIKFFGRWAETVQTHELERSWKRIRTRQAHVNNSERELEAKRQHYVKVVEAFQSALQLLNGT